MHHSSHPLVSDQDPAHMGGVSRYAKGVGWGTIAGARALAGLGTLAGVGGVVLIGTFLWQGQGYWCG